VKSRILPGWKHLGMVSRLHSRNATTLPCMCVLRTSCALSMLPKSLVSMHVGHMRSLLQDRVQVLWVVPLCPQVLQAQFQELGFLETHQHREVVYQPVDLYRLAAIALEVQRRPGLHLDLGLGLYPGLSLDPSPDLSPGQVGHLQLLREALTLPQEAPSLSLGLYLPLGLCLLPGRFPPEEPNLPPAERLARHLPRQATPHRLLLRGESS
jgi:hypothetical protein